MDEDVSPSSGQQFSAGFIVMDSQTESMDGDIMQILPALNQSNGVSSSTSSVNLRLFEDDQSCDDDKHRDSPKGQLLVTDSEFEQPPKRKIDINTSSDDVVSESEEGDITVIEKLHPEDNNSKEKGTKRKRSDSDSDGKDAQKNEEDDPGSSFHSTGRENLGSYNQAELSQSHCRGNRLPIQQVLSQADMFADITEDEGSSSQSDHISCLQLSSKPMLVPDTVDESSPTELPPSPNASSIHIIPSSPTDGSFQDTSACSNNDTSATDHTSGVDLEVEEEYNPYVSATLAEEDPKCRTKKKRDHNVEREGEDQERQNQSGKEKVDEVRTEGRSKEGSSLSGKEGGSRMESVGEYDPGGTPTLAGAQLHDTKKKTSIDSDTSVIRIEDSNETMEVISISSTQDKDLSESQHYSLHLSPSQPSQRNIMASQGNTSMSGSQSIIGKYEHINLSHGEGIQRGPSPAGQSQRGQSQVGQNIGGQVQTRQTESQKGISQGFQILGKSIQGQSDSMQTQGKLIQGQSQGDLVGSQQGNQGLWHTAGKANQGMNQREVEMSQEGRAVRQKTAAASPGNSQGQVQHASEQSQGVFLQGSSPSIEVTMVTTTSQNLLATTTTKLPNRGDSQEPGPSHAITPPVKSTPRYQTDSDDIKVETMDLAFSLERPQIDGTSEVGLSEDSRTEVFRRNKDKDSKKTIIKDASDEDENLAFHRLSGESSSVKSEEIQGGGGTSPKENLQKSVYSQDTIPSDVSTALQMGSVEVLGSQPAGLQKAVPKDGSHMPRMQTAVSSDTGYKVEESVQQSQVMAQHQSQNSEDTELYDPNQIQGGNVSQLTSGVRVPSQSTQGNMIMHQHISVNSQGSYASQRGTVSQGHAAVQGSSQNIQGNLPVHLQGMTNMSQGGIVSQVPTIVGGPYPNISGNAYVPESVPTCTSLQSAYLTNSQGQINSSMVQPNYSQNAVGQQQINVSSPRGQLQHNLSRESQDEIRDWLTSRPSFSDRTFQERNMNTYSAYKARKASQKNSPVKAATQERIMVQQTENVMVSTDPYAFHGSQSQGLYQPNPAEINTAGVTVPTHHNPIPPLHHDTPVSTRKKRRPATRKKVTTRTRQHPIAKVHFSDQITTTASAAIETGAVIGQSTRMHMPMHSPSTSSSSDKSPRVPPLHRSSFTTPVMQSPHPPSVLAPPTSLHHTPGRSRMTDTTPSSTSAPEVDLNWVFTPSPDLTALVNLTEKSDVQQKNAIVAQMSGQPSFEIVSKIAVTGTMVKHFILREKYHGGVRKGYVVEEEEDKADIRTKYQTEVIPPVDYISPSRSTSTVSTGDLGDISSFSSGSIRSNMERSGSSLETTASLSSTVAPPVDTSRGMAVSSTTAESDIVMTTGNTGRDKNVITIAPLPSVTSTSTAPPKGQLKCSTPREDTHKGTPSLSPKQSLPSSVEADHSPQEASTIEKSGSRLFDETHQSSDLFAGTSEASADKGDTEGGKEDPVADEEGGDASGRGKKQKKTVVKRGRGRPRRTTAAAVQEVEVLEEDEADEEEKDKGDNVEEKSTSGSDKVSPPVPYQDEQSKEASGEEIGSGIIQSKPVLGARVIAKWKDKFYYPGVISRVDKARFQVKFDDGDVLLIKPHDLLLIERLPIGQPVMVPTGPEAFYEGALIVGHVRQGGRTHYTVEQDGGARKQFRSSQVILNEDQAESLIKDTNCVKSGPASTADKKIADVTLDNLVEGKRRTGSKYEQGEVDNPPAPSSTQGRKRKYKVDVPPSATSTPTPNRAKRHKVEDPDITPRFGYTADSPAIPKNTRRSPRKSRIGLFDKTSAPTKKIFKGMVFLLTYVEKSSEDRKVEKDFLKDPSLSSDESASESATEELVPFDKARLKNEIEAAGGTVLACYDKDQIPLIKQCYLISNTYQRTVKYFQSLAAGIPCVSHLWIHHSVAQEKVLDYHSYMLQAGISIEKKKIIEWNSRRGVLESLCVLITSSDVKFKQQWSSVLEAAGCHVVQKLPSPTSERPVNVILADKTCTETSLRKYRELPIVGCEWVIQCLINGQRMGFDAHEHYRYDHQV